MKPILIFTSALFSSKSLKALRKKKHETMKERYLDEAVSMLNRVPESKKSDLKRQIRELARRLGVPAPKM